MCELIAHLLHLIYKCYLGYICITKKCLGRNLFPATGYLYLVWETLCMSSGEVLVDTKVIFEDIKFLRATTINPDVKLEFVISVQPFSGNFEVSSNDDRDHF